MTKKKKSINTYLSVKIMSMYKSLNFSLCGTISHTSYNNGDVTTNTEIKFL